MKKKAEIVIFSCIIFLMAGIPFSYGQEKKVDLKDKRITLNLENESLDIIFCHLIQKYDVPIGLVGSTFDNHNDYLFQTQFLYPQQIDFYLSKPRLERDHTFSIKVLGARLEEVLDLLVEQIKYYKWEINNGVVNIIPVKGMDERYEKLLELKISSYTLEKDKPAGFIKREIGALPELKQFLVENKLHFSIGNDVFILNLNREISESMNFSNLSFKDLLNKITKSKRGGWYLKRKLLRPEAEKEYIEFEI